MGHYREFKSKHIKLRRDTPLEVIDFLDSFINKGNYETKTPDHPLFKEERWDSIFGKWAWYEKPFFINEKGYWILFVWCDVKYGGEEIELFAKWIMPYVIGHKPKEYIGWLLREESTERENVYIERLLK